MEWMPNSSITSTDRIYIIIGVTVKVRVQSEMTTALFLNEFLLIVGRR